MATQLDGPLMNTPGVGVFFSNPWGGGVLQNLAHFAPSVNPPVITIATSLPPATANTPVVVTITPTSGVPLRKAWIDAHFPGIIGDEAIHTGNRFGAYYTNGVNTRVTTVGGGFTFTILRDGGWPVGSFPLVTSFDVSATDTIGNSTP